MALAKEGINDFDLSALNRLSLVGSGGMGALTFHPETTLQQGENMGDFDLLQDFDISTDGERIHTATAGGLLSVSLSYPVLDYVNLLALMGYLTLSQEDVEQMYRRMVFNYLTENKDDHCKNFSYLVTNGADNKWHWHLAPAYDLTRCTEGYNGEHATSVNGTGHPSLTDMVAVGVKNKIN